MTARTTGPGVVRNGHPTARRVGLIVGGVIFVLAGAVAWGWETEYGSGHGFSVEVIGDEAKVYDTDGESGNVVVFEGTRAEADAYVEERRSLGRSYTMPALILVAGGALAFVGVRPARKRGKALQPTSVESGPSPAPTVAIGARVGGGAPFT